MLLYGKEGENAEVKLKMIKHGKKSYVQSILKVIRLFFPPLNEHTIIVIADERQTNAKHALKQSEVTL